MLWVEIARWAGLAPLGWLLALHVAGRTRTVSVWWLASGFAVSWVADSIVLALPRDHPAGWMISAIYPATQASIMGAAIIYRRERAVLFAILAHAAACASILLHGVEGPEYASRILAWGTIAVVAWNFWQLGTLRLALLVYFGAGLLAWIVHTEWLIVATWYPYQLARVVGIALFCLAAARDRVAVRPAIVRVA